MNDSEAIFGVVVTVSWINSNRELKRKKVEEHQHHWGKILYPIHSGNLKWAEEKEAHQL